MIDIERRDGVALVRVRGRKANAMNPELIAAIDTALDELEGPIVVTADGTSFSAGLALPELVDLDRPAISEMIDGFERAMYRVLTYPHATVAAINGHAFAGGCVLAMMCDVRVMATGSAKIGLNEVQLGIGLPAIVIETLRLRVAPPAFGAIVLEGRLLSPDEALRCHLVDELVEPGSLVARSVEIATARGRSPLAYAQIKRSLLAPVVDAFQRRREIDRDAWLDTWFSDHGQRTLRAAVDRITKRV